MGNRVDKLVKLFWDRKPFRPLNGNGIAKILKDKNLMKWLLLAGVTSINYKNGKLHNQYGREIVFYMCDGKYGFYIRGGDI